MSNIITQKQKERIIDMIVSPDAEIRSLGISLACNYPEWVLGMKPKQDSSVIDFWESCMIMGNKDKKSSSGYFTYNGTYYELKQAGSYLSCHMLVEITKEEYEKHKTEFTNDTIT